MKCRELSLFDKFKKFQRILPVIFPYIFIISILAAAACGAKKPKVSHNRTMPMNYIPGSFVMELKPDKGDSDLNAIGEKITAETGCQIQTAERISWDISSGVLPESLQNTYNLNIFGCDLTADTSEKVLSVLGENEVIASVEAEMAMKQTVSENDPYKDDQGHLKLIRRDEACDLVKNGEGVVKVAVVDTGVNLNHPDLSEMFVRNENGQIIGANFVGKGASMQPDSNFDDQQGHGTHVAGLIAAQANNGEGGVGVASCANVKIIPVRVLDSKGEGRSVEIDRGILWAAEQGAQVINLSLGGQALVPSKSGENFKKQLFEHLAARNVVVFAAAGNEGTRHGEEYYGRYVYDFPASYDHVISVAAVDDQGQITDFSNRGDRVDIATPGYELLSTYEDSYKRLSGTSMASPVATGSYALALYGILGSLKRADRIDNEVASQLLLKASSSSFRLDAADVASHGVLDVKMLADAALKKYKTSGSDSTNPVTDPAPVPSKNFGFVGLKDGQSLNSAILLTVKGLPKGTSKVLLYWGSTSWSFEKIFVGSGSLPKQVSTEYRYYLRGSRELTAQAVDSKGKTLAETTVFLKGL